MPNLDFFADAADISSSVNVFARRDLCGDLGEVEAHRLGVARWQDEAGVSISHRRGDLRMPRGAAPKSIDLAQAAWLTRVLRHPLSFGLRAFRSAG